MKYVFALLLFCTTSTHVFGTNVEDLSEEERLRQQIRQSRENFNVEKVASASYKSSLFHTFLNTLEMMDSSQSYTGWKLAMVPVKLIELSHLVGKLNPNPREQVIMDHRWKAMKYYAIGWGLEISCLLLDVYGESYGWNAYKSAGLKLLKSRFFLELGL